MMELEEFKVEIQTRFKKSKFNNTYKFPRISEKNTDTLPKNYKEKSVSHYKSKSSLAQSNRGQTDKLYNEDMRTLDKTVNEKLISDKVFKVAIRFNTEDNFKTDYDMDNNEINEARGKIKSAKNLNKISFGKPPNYEVQPKSKPQNLMDINKHTQPKIVKSGSRNTFNFKQKSDVLNKESMLDSAYELSVNNTVNEINQDKNNMESLRGMALSSQSTLLNNIGVYNNMVLGSNTKTLKALNSARELNRYSQSHTAMQESHPTYQPLTRREPELKREMNEFLSNYSHSSHHIKKDSMKKSASWVKLGDSIYCTAQDRDSKSKNAKTKALPDQRRSKSKTKQPKVMHKNPVSIKKLKSKKDSSLGTKHSSKKYISGKQSMKSSKNNSKLHSSSGINLMIPDDKFRVSQLGRTTTFDVTSLKKNAKNYSPSRVTDFYEPKDEFISFIPYNEMKFQNTVDLRNTHQLHINNSNDSYLNFQVTFQIIKFRLILNPVKTRTTGIRVTSLW